jgi:cobalt-zinc-cadmium efflux system membrane fusion protein
LEKYDQSLIPGTFMNAEIAVESAQALALPEDAIVNFENNYYVFKVIGNNNYEMQEVKTGETKDGYVQLKDESLKGVSVVIKGAYSLLMKLKNTGEDE